MPILNVKVSTAPDAVQSARIAATLTELTAQILLKDASLTSVAITHQPREHWFIGAASLAQLGMHSFYLDILVTDETNTAKQKSAYIAAVFKAMQEILGELHDVSYIHINDTRATAWGYGGQTQQYRAVKKSLEHG
jgi:4-oxalocrotonate tautomerase